MIRWGRNWDKRSGCVSGLVLVSALALTLVLGSALTSRPQAQPALPKIQKELAVSKSCEFEPAGSGVVASVIDGRSFVLADGREVRLVGLEVPIYRSDETGPRAAAGHAARAGLESILAGATVTLSRAHPSRDRYDRTLSYVHVGIEGSPRSVASAMLAAGFARVGSPVGSMACAIELLSQERAARAAKLGLWADPYYVIFEAGNGAALLGHQGQFAIAEGKVSSVRTGGGIVYINFGRRWSEALTVTILKRHERIFLASGITPGLLENRRIRVRGWIDERGGPRIEATRPEQIEIAELM
jgi:endonuclease YncB( thermonuclease family)